LEKVPSAVPAIFQLKEAEPTTDPFQAENDFYVFRLVEVETPRPLTAEEASAPIRESLRKEKALAATKALATENHGKLAKLLEQGKSWEEATAETLSEVSELPAFSRMEPAMGEEDSAEVMESAFRLGAGELSAPVEGRDSVFLVFVKERDRVDVEAFESQKGTFTSRVEARKEREVFQEWLRLRRQAANIQMLGQG
jgi:parvulin-like peptidyl-prolyl isomerase